MNGENAKFSVEWKVSFYYVRFKTENVIGKLGNILFNLNFQ